MSVPSHLSDISVGRICSDVLGIRDFKIKEEHDILWFCLSRWVVKGEDIDTVVYIEAAFKVMVDLT